MSFNRSSLNMKGTSSRDYFECRDWGVAAAELARLPGPGGLYRLRRYSNNNILVKGHSHEIITECRDGGVAAAELAGLPWPGGLQAAPGRRPVQAQAGDHRHHHQLSQGQYGTKGRKTGKIIVVFTISTHFRFVFFVSVFRIQIWIGIGSVDPDPD